MTTMQDHQTVIDTDIDHNVDLNTVVLRNGDDQINPDDIADLHPWYAWAREDVCEDGCE